MDNKQKHKRKMKLAYLQENMEIMSEFDQKIHVLDLCSEVRKMI
jgi:hypothetical protein